MPDSLSDFTEKEELRQVIRRLQGEVAKSKAKTDDLVQAVYQAARDAMFALGAVQPVVKPERDARSKHEEVAVWHLTDWQGAKLTTSYNSDVMVERVMRFCAKAEHITNIQRADHPVKNCTVIFGGDMVEGLFQFATQPFEIDASIFEQYVRVSRLLVGVVRYALSIYDKVTVVAEWGNHGRIGSKRDAVPRSDNFDRMCYELARQLLAGETRLKWEDCPEDIQRVEIGNYRALAIHCDEVGRNGFASPMTIVNHVNRWRSGAYPWEFRDVYGGHYHTHYELALANGQGRFFGTGSTESDNRYAGVMLAATATPSQRLHFVSPSKGYVTSQYQIYVDK